MNYKSHVFLKCSITIKQTVLYTLRIVAFGNFHLYICTNDDDNVLTM